MKKLITNILLSVFNSVVFYLLSINFIFYVPTVGGNGYAPITYIVGACLALIVFAASMIMFTVMSRKKK